MITAQTIVIMPSSAPASIAHAAERLVAHHMTHDASIAQAHAAAAIGTTGVIG